MSATGLVTKEKQKLFRKKVHSEPRQASKMELFVKIIDG